MISLVAANPASACSAFLLKGGTYTVVGFNENVVGENEAGFFNGSWYYHIPGMVVVNKRAIRKHNLSWDRMVGTSDGKPDLTWTSKYGSVTFNALGVDLPFYGMNESGLFVVELALDKTYSNVDRARPNMFWAQWIQYQLDNYSTVEEVIEHVKSGPVIDWWPQFEGSHFFVSDADGNAAAIELINGAPVIHHGSSMPVTVLNNDTYVRETARLAEYKGFGGDRNFDMRSTDWNDRFIKLSYLLKNYTAASGSPRDYAWKMLDSVHSGVWQLVGDVRQRVLYFKTQAVPKIKSIDLKKLDFSAATPILYADLHTNFAGDITAALRPWSPGANVAYVRVGLPAAYQDKFFNSPDYDRVVQNLDDYAKGIEEQTKQAALR